MIKQDQSTKYAKTAYKVPYLITGVHNNGTINVQMNKVNDVYNILKLYPYKEWSFSLSLQSWGCMKYIGPK